MRPDGTERRLRRGGRGQRRLRAREATGRVGASVILLEAGGPDRTRLVRKPGMIAIFHNVPALKKRLDWGYYTVPQAAARGRRIPQPRGWVLGGSGSINGMLFVRGNRKNYDDWAAAGCKGWSFADVLPSFRRMEDWEGGASELRGAGGPIKVTRQQDLTPASEAFLAALAETAGVPRIEDYNGESQEGASVFQQNVSGGLRYSSSVGYLDDHGLPGLTVWTGAHGSAGRHRGRPRGRGRGHHRVRARDDPGRPGGDPQRRRLRLAAAADAVRRRPGGAPARARHRRRRRPAGGRQPARPHVRADDLRDEDGPQPRHHPVLRGGVMREAIRGGTWMGRTVFEAAGFVRSGRAGEIPDLQLQALPWSYPFPNQDAPTRHKVDKRSALTIMTTLIYPQSRGTLRLASADPAAAPLIDPGYLTEAADTEVLLDGMELVREVMSDKVIAGDVTSSFARGGTTRTGPRWRGSCRTARPRSTTRSGPAGWASTSERWSTRRCGCSALTGSGWPTPRSCPASPAGTRTPRR